MNFSSKIKTYCFRTIKWKINY